VPKGLVRSSDQDGRRWAKGEVALKFVVKVNVAREKRMLYYKEDRSAIAIAFGLIVLQEGL
jgi:hypothetical protein